MVHGVALLLSSCRLFQDGKPPLEDGAFWRINISLFASTGGRVSSGTPSAIVHGGGSTILANMRVVTKFSRY